MLLKQLNSRSTLCERGARGAVLLHVLHVNTVPFLTATCAEGREVIIGRKAGEAVMRGAHVFVPGTLAVSAGVLCVELGAGVALRTKHVGVLLHSACLDRRPADTCAPAPNQPAGIMQGDSVAVSVGLELPGTDRYPFTRGTVLGSGEFKCPCKVHRLTGLH